MVYRACRGRVALPLAGPLALGILWSVLLGLAISGAGRAADSPPAPTPVALEKVTSEEVTSTVVGERLKQLESSTDLDEPTKVKIRAVYEQASRELEEWRKRTAATAAFKQMADSATAQAAEKKAALAASGQSQPMLLPAKATLPELESGLAQREERLAKCKEDLALQEAEPKRRAARRKEIPEALAKVRERLADLERQLAAPTPSDSRAALATLADRTALLAQRQSALAEIGMLEQEAASYDATAQVLPLERDLAAAQLAQAEAEAARWRQQVNLCRQQEAQARAREAQNQIKAVKATPALKPLADENSELASRGKLLATQIEETSGQLQNLNLQLEELTRHFERTQAKVRAVGLSNAIGLLLRTQRATLRDADAHEWAIRARQPEIRNTQLAWFELEDRRSEMANLEGEIERTLRRLGAPGDAFEQESLETAVRELLTSRRELTDAVLASYNRHFDLLVDLDSVEQQLITLTRQYAAYVDERVLWIASAEPLLSPQAVSELRSTAEAIEWLLDSRGWADIGQALALDALGQPVVWLVALALLGPLFYYQRWLRQKLGEIGTLAGQSALYRFLPTINALALTAMIAAIWPAALWFVSWRLSTAMPAAALGKAIAAGLFSAGWCYLPLELLRQLCRGRGVAEAHFGWPPGSLRALGRNLRWYLPVMLPLAFVSETMRAQGIAAFDNSLGRLAFIAALLIATAFMQRVLRPSGDLFRHVLAEGREGWFYRFRHVWYALGVLAPLGMAVLAAAGYYYTARQLGLRIRETVYLPLALVVLGAVFSRWVLVVRRKLAIERARQKRAVQAESAAAGEPSTVGSLPSPVAPEPDLTHVSAQTRRLLQSFLVVGALAGIWFIWVDILPALSVLDRLPLWPTTVEVAETINGADGSVTTRTTEREQYTTVADLFLAALTLLMTVIAARNIPGLLQISIPQSWPLDAGARYAITTISRYLIVILGLVLGCGKLGIGWAKVQWLIAAVSVGLGFGLQEIFANFVSGLILLFERPIRVGDIVTIEGVSGVVSRIQTRATTVTNWDRQEFIVPNKEFITGRLLNWTLADKVNRVVLKVGVAYGSDTELACEVLRRIAAEHPSILKEPPPTVGFEGFGASSLDLVLRCFLPHLDNRAQVIHDLHTAVHREFDRLGIEIPFPQQDIHLRTDQPLATMLERPTAFPALHAGSR